MFTSEELGLQMPSLWLADGFMWMLGTLQTVLKPLNSTLNQICCAPTLCQKVFWMFALWQ